MRSALVGNNLLLGESLLKRSHDQRQRFSLLLLVPQERRHCCPSVHVRPCAGKLQLGPLETLFRKSEDVL